MAEIVRDNRSKGVFQIERGEAFPLDARPAGMGRVDPAFAVVVEIRGMRRARLVEAADLAGAERLAKQAAMNQPRGAFVRVAEAVGEHNGETVFEDRTRFTVNA